MGNYFLESKGDDNLLKIIQTFFEENNFEIFNWKNICKDIFVNENFLTIKKPNKKNYNNLNKGLNIYKSLGIVDLVQSMIIQNMLKSLVEKTNKN